MSLQNVSPPQHLDIPTLDDVVEAGLDIPYLTDNVQDELISEANDLFTPVGQPIGEPEAATPPRPAPDPNPGPNPMPDPDPHPANPPHPEPPTPKPEPGPDTPVMEWDHERLAPLVGRIADELAEQWDMKLAEALASHESRMRELIRDHLIKRLPEILAEMQPRDPADDDAT